MSDVKPGTALAAAPGAHRQDESPAGYSLAGWSPPEPTSASPARLRMHYSGPAGRQFCSERPTVSYSTVSAEGSTPARAILLRTSQRWVELREMVTELLRLLLSAL